MSLAVSEQSDNYPSSPILVPFTDEAAEINKKNIKYQREMMRESDQDDAMALFARYAEQIKRIAMIVACGRYSGKLRRAEIDEDDMAFAKRLVEYSLSQFVTTVRRDMVENLVEANRKKVLDKIRETGTIARSQLLRGIRNINRRDLNEIIAVLIEANQVAEISEPGKTKPTTKYRFLRD